MTDDFFEEQPTVPTASLLRRKGAFLFRCLFYTSIAGFISGSAFGYFHIKGWAPNAEKNLILYAITFGIGAILSTAFVLYQDRKNQLKPEKIRRFKRSNPSQAR
jgi:hypothetical protein